MDASARRRNTTPSTPPSTTTCVRMRSVNHRMSKGQKPLLKLLGLAEELLFSFPLPSEVVKKYEDLRNIAFTKVGLVSNAATLWRMQRDVQVLVNKRESHSTQTDSYDQPLLSTAGESIPYIDPAVKIDEITSWWRVMYLELATSLESAYALLSRQQNQLNTFLLSMVQVSAKLYGLAGKDEHLLEGLAQVRRDSDKLSLVREAKQPQAETEAQHQSTLQECKRIEAAYEAALEEVSKHLGLAESRIGEALQCYYAALEASNEEASRIDLERVTQLSEEVKDKAHLANQVESMKHQIETREVQMRESKKSLKKKMKSRLQEKLQAQAQEHILALQSFDAGKVVKTVTNSEEAMSAMRSDFKAQLEQVHQQYSSQVKELTEELNAVRQRHTEELSTSLRQLEEDLHVRERELVAAKAEISFLTETQRPAVEKPKVAHKEAQAAPPQEEPHAENSQLLALIEEKLQWLYQRYAAQQKSWMQSLAQRKEQLLAKYFSLTDRVQLLLYTDFAAEFADTMARDRLWLADKLTLLARENEKLAFRLTTSGRDPRKEAAQRLKDKAQEDMKATSETLKEFESARTSLLTKLFPD